MIKPNVGDVVLTPFSILAKNEKLSGTIIQIKEVHNIEMYYVQFSCDKQVIKNIDEMEEVVVK